MSWITSSPHKAIVCFACLFLLSCANRTILQGSSDITSENKKVAVWFVKNEAGKLNVVPVYRPCRSQDSVAEAVKALLEGPSAEESKIGLGSEIPRGTILLGTKQIGSDVELNLSQRFATGGGASSFDIRLKQLNKTVSGATRSGDVYLSIEGERLNLIPGEGIEVHQPINKTASM